MLGGQAIDPVSQGLLLQQAALALQMAHLSSPQAAASHDQEAASAAALHAALRAQQGDPLMPLLSIGLSWIRLPNKPRALHSLRRNGIKCQRL